MSEEEKRQKICLKILCCVEFIAEGVKWEAFHVETVSGRWDLNVLANSRGDNLCDVEEKLDRAYPVAVHRLQKKFKEYF